MMNKSSRQDVKRFQRARQRIARERQGAREREQTRRLSPPLFDLPGIEEGDR